MIMSEMPIKVLLIDDDKTASDALIGEATFENIEISHVLDWENGKLFLEENRDIQFVILDGKGKMREDQDAPKDSFVHSAITGLALLSKEQKRFLPFCVNTGYVKNFEESIDEEIKVFNKDHDSAPMFNYIKEQVSNSELNGFKLRYPGVFKVFESRILSNDDEARLIRMIKAMETESPEKELFEAGRTLLENVFLILINDFDCIPIQCLKQDGRPNLMQCAIYMGSIGESKTLNIHGQEYPNRFISKVPNHISWTFGYLKENLSELSHTYRYTWNIYAYNSVVFALMEILTWLPEFINAELK